MKKYKVKNLSDFNIRIVGRSALIKPREEIIAETDENVEEQLVDNLTKLQKLGYLTFEKIEDKTVAVEPKRKKEPEPVIKEEVEQVEEVGEPEIKFSERNTKSELIEIAEKIGIEISPKASKKEILEVLEESLENTDN
jgi:hypothetical protein